jgi:hypothetical protein
MSARIASYLLFGLDAIPVELEFLQAEPDADFGGPAEAAVRESVRRAGRAIVSSGFRSPGQTQVSVYEAGQAGSAHRSRIEVPQYRLAPADLIT